MAMNYKIAHRRWTEQHSLIKEGLTWTSDRLHKTKGVLSDSNSANRLLYATAGVPNLRCLAQSGG